MKNKNKLIKSLLLLGTTMVMLSCNNFLDRRPEVNPGLEDYFGKESYLLAYVDGRYANILPSHGQNTGGSPTGWDYGIFKDDSGTDNQVSKGVSNKYLEGQWLVGLDGSWGFGEITKINLFFEQVLPKYEAGLISGNDANIKHYIGEAYFLRAYEYFKTYRSYGDMPIITRPLPDDQDTLTAHSNRVPRNEVARFIISDLDKAIEFMADATVATTRISQDAALLMKSRVALFEATWLKYFKNTPFVPNGEGWPGKTSDYNANYQYSTGSIDAEIEYFLTQAMDASKKVADKYYNSLTVNNGAIQQTATDPVNKFMDMYGTEDLSGYSEVLLWRQYAQGYVGHSAVTNAQSNNNGVGITKGLVDAFLMKDGLPIYASPLYKGDTIIPVSATAFQFANRIDRDNRLSLFLKEPGQVNIIFKDGDVGSLTNEIELLPNLTATDYATGYVIRKGNSYHRIQAQSGGSFTGCVLFRSAEALLNYIEASYEKNGTIDADAAKYWKALRDRAGVDSDYQKTIDATDMDIEKLGDWGAYSAGALVDKTLYNIRRERRCEYIAEGLRDMDLRRWRAMDQLKTDRYHVKGYNIWEGALNGEYYNFTYEGGAGSGVQMSNPADGTYLNVYRIATSDAGYNGLTWYMAHYLSPIGVKEMSLTSPNGDPASSVIYQNPYWPIETSKSALK